MHVAFRWLVSGALALSVAACAPAATTPPRSTAVAPSDAKCDANAFGSHASFLYDHASLRARGASPSLLAKLDASPYAYFRTLGPQFAQRTCAGFADLRWRLPVTAIHGDPHVEQFAVTLRSAGLEDFDQSGWGPAVVDLVRYAASLHLACREVSFPCDAEAAAGAYFAAYRNALDRKPERKLPTVVARLREQASKTPEAWLAWSESLMQPLAPDVEAAAKLGWSRLRKQLTEARPDRPANQYDVVRMGALQLGMGSGLDTKMLFRVRGPTDSPIDDLVVEARSTTPPAGNQCVWRPNHGGSLQPLFFMFVLGPRLPEIIGAGSLTNDPDSPEFWVQSWELGYHELEVRDLRSQAELVEVAEDAARQLAGHMWTKFPEPLIALQRHSQLEAFDATRTRALDMARTFANESVVSWERFRSGR